VAGSFASTNAQGQFVQSVLESSDGGASWSDITIGADGNGVHVDHHALAFDASGKLLDGNDGGVWRLQNAAVGAIQWADLNSDLNDIQSIGIALHPSNPN